MAENFLEIDPRKLFLSTIQNSPKKWQFVIFHQLIDN